VTFRPPEETEVFDLETQEVFQTCRIPVFQHKKLRGYVPLPLRYQRVWLELCYCIVLYTQMWRLWAKEEQNATRKTRKEKAAILRQNSGALVAQHRLARLLAVDELVSWSHDTTTSGQERVRVLDEWKIRWSRDWFNTTYDRISRSDYKFLNADPIRPENRQFLGEFIILLARILLPDRTKRAIGTWTKKAGECCRLLMSWTSGLRGKSTDSRRCSRQS
jgi:hypothetical protein